MPISLRQEEKNTTLVRKASFIETYLKGLDKADYAFMLRHKYWIPSLVLSKGTDLALTEERGKIFYVLFVTFIPSSDHVSHRLYFASLPEETKLIWLKVHIGEEGMRYKRIRKLSRPTHLIVEHMSMCFTNHNTITRHQSYCSRFVHHLLFKLV